MDMGINRPTKTRSNQPKKRTGFRGHLDDMSTFLFLGVTPLCQKVWNLEGASRYLHIRRRTLYTLAARGMVPGVKIGGQWRFRRSQLDGLFEAERGKPSAAETQAPPAMDRRP